MKKFPYSRYSFEHTVSASNQPGQFEDTTGAAPISVLLFHMMKAMKPGETITIECKENS